MKNLQSSIPGLISAIQSADSGSFSEAARALNLTPAAVSKNVAALETQLKVRLFNRTTRKLSLTEEGKAFVAQARLGLQALDDASRLATQSAQPQGLVRVNAPVGFGRRFVLPLLPDFFKAQPLVQVELVLNDQQVDLVAGGFDVGIRGGSQPPEGMVARTLCALDPILVASPAYLAARGSPASPADLAQHELIRVRFLNGRMNAWPLRESPRSKASQALDLHARLVLSDPEVVLDAALMHLGIARIARHHAAAAIASGALVEVLPKHKLENDQSMAVFYPHRAGIAPRVRVFVDHLIAALSSNGLLLNK
jgi:DNA-binding transcriptional LysR family regulator